MNIGVIGNNIEDIKLLMDIKTILKNNYYYIYENNYSNISNDIKYLIDNFNIKILIILDSKVNIENIQLKYNNLLIFNTYNILLDYINETNMYNDILVISDKNISDKNINTLKIDKQIIDKSKSNIIKYITYKLKTINNNFKYICCYDNTLLNILSDIHNINILNLVIPIKYILSKYVENNNVDNLEIFTVDNKNMIKTKILKKYNIDVDVKFINTTSDYLINIDSFSGPLDLLLHLIKEADIDIYNINISEITDQYLEYIKKMQELNLEIASSYLVMASELMYLKSNELLPKKETIEKDEEEISREELINRLIEYKKYKEVIKDFKNLENEGSKYFMRMPMKLEIKDDSLDNDKDLNDLINAFNNFLQRKKEDMPLNTTVTKKEYSVHDRCSSIRKTLKYRKKMNFTELFDNYNKPYVIVSFLSVLELLKSGEIYLIQNDIFDNIIIGIKDDKYE